MTDQQITEQYEALSKRDKIKLLEILSKPWIEAEAISSNATSIQQIINLRNLSKHAVKKTAEVLKMGADRSKGYTRFTLRKKRRK